MFFHRCCLFTAEQKCFKRQPRELQAGVHGVLDSVRLPSLGPPPTPSTGSPGWSHPLNWSKLETCVRISHSLLRDASRGCAGCGAACLQGFGVGRGGGWSALTSSPPGWSWDSSSPLRRSQISTGEKQEKAISFARPCREQSMTKAWAMALISACCSQQPATLLYRTGQGCSSPAKGLAPFV